MKNLIHIFGASGAGTTTLGMRIANEMGFKHMDTDDYYWMPTNPPYTSSRPINERLAMINKDISLENNIVLSGSLTDWGDVLIPIFTFAIRVNTDTEIRIERLEKREKERFGKRIAIGGDMYDAHIEFIEWARAYDTGDLSTRSKAKHDEWQKLLKCDLIEINGANIEKFDLSRINVRK